MQRAAQVEEMMKQIEHLKQELSRAEAEQKTLQLCQKSQTTEQVSQLEFLKQVRTIFKKIFTIEFRLNNGCLLVFTLRGTIKTFSRLY